MTATSMITAKNAIDLDWQKTTRLRRENETFCRGHFLILRTEGDGIIEAKFETGQLHFLSVGVVS